MPQGFCPGHVVRAGGRQWSGGEVRSSVLDLLSVRRLLTCGDAKQAVGSMSLGFRVEAQLEVKTWVHWHTEGRGGGSGGRGPSSDKMEREGRISEGASVRW